MPIDFSILNQTNPSTKMAEGVLNQVQQILDRQLRDKERQDRMALGMGGLANQGDQIGVQKQLADQEGKNQQGLLAAKQQELQIQQQLANQQGQYQQGSLGVQQGQLGINQQQANQQGQYQQGQLSIANKEANTNQARAESDIAKNQSEINEREAKTQMALQQAQDMAQVDPKNRESQRAFLAKWGGPQAIQSFDQGTAALTKLNLETAGANIKNIQDGYAAAHSQAGFSGYMFPQALSKVQDSANKKVKDGLISPDQARQTVNKFIQDNKEHVSKVYNQFGVANPFDGLDNNTFSDIYAQMGAAYGGELAKVVTNPAERNQYQNVLKQFSNNSAMIDSIAPATNVKSTPEASPQQLDQIINTSDYYGGVWQ